MTDPAVLYEEVRDEMQTVLVGNEELVEGMTVSLLTRGHILLEGVPGVAKTTLANLFARVTGLEYNRIQMTPDVLPADITGTHIYRESTGEFALQRGPIFANVVVADEINRATPKTQSALLEAMEETRVTIEGETLELPEPFIVIATQNPIEMEGTWELPEAQRDRFQMKLIAELPDSDDEHELLDRFDDDPLLGPDHVDQVVTRADIGDAREVVSEVYVDDKIKDYIVDVLTAVRDSPNVEHGGSPRASLALMNTSKAAAAIRGRNYVIPDDVKRLANDVLVHRLVLSTDAELGDVSSHDVIDDILQTVESPSVTASANNGDSQAAADGGRDDEAVGDDSPFDFE